MSSLDMRRLGKRAPRFDHRIPRLAAYVRRKALPAAPASVDWISKVANWPMMANDRLGDCTIAALGHIIEQQTTYVGDPRVLTDDQIVGLYSAITGYNPADPSTDQGAVETDVLNYWLNTGADGDKITAYASVEPGNVESVKDAVWLFGSLYIGLALPNSAQSQDVWDVPAGGTSGDGAPGSWGGHAVPVMAYDADGLTCITWGSTKRMTWAFWQTYCDEAYAVLDRDFFNANSIDPAGISWDDLQADMAALRPVAPPAKIDLDAMKAGVGAKVHFFSSAIPGAPSGFNGQGNGPYAATVTQAFGEAYVNLAVSPPFANVFHEGSVAHRDHPNYGNTTRYWVWPHESEAPQ